MAEELTSDNESKSSSGPRPDVPHVPAQPGQGSLDMATAAANAAAQQEQMAAAARGDIARQPGYFRDDRGVELFYRAYNGETMHTLPAYNADPKEIYEAAEGYEEELQKLVNDKAPDTAYKDLLDDMMMQRLVMAGERKLHNKDTGKVDTRNDLIGRSSKADAVYLVTREYYEQAKKQEAQASSGTEASQKAKALGGAAETGATESKPAEPLVSNEGETSEPKPGTPLVGKRDTDLLVERGNARWDVLRERQAAEAKLAADAAAHAAAVAAAEAKGRAAAAEAARRKLAAAVSAPTTAAATTPAASTAAPGPATAPRPSAPRSPGTAETAAEKKARLRKEHWDKIVDLGIAEDVKTRARDEAYQIEIARGGVINKHVYNLAEEYNKRIEVIKGRNVDLAEALAKIRNEAMNQEWSRQTAITQDTAEIVAGLLENAYEGEYGIDVIGREDENFEDRVSARREALGVNVSGPPTYEKGGERHYMVPGMPNVDLVERYDLRSGEILSQTVMTLPDGLKSRNWRGREQLRPEVEMLMADTREADDEVTTDSRRHRAGRATGRAAGALGHGIVVGGRGLASGAVTSAAWGSRMAGHGVRGAAGAKEWAFESTGKIWETAKNRFSRRSKPGGGA